MKGLRERAADVFAEQDNFDFFVRVICGGE